MIWETLGFAVLGLALSGAAARWLPGRFPQRGSLLLATGPAGALLGGLIARVVIGPGHPIATMTVAAGVSVALLSLLLGGNGLGGNGRSATFRWGDITPPRPTNKASMAP